MVRSGTAGQVSLVDVGEMDVGVLDEYGNFREWAAEILASRVSIKVQAGILTVFEDTGFEDNFQVCLLVFCSFYITVSSIHPLATLLGSIACQILNRVACLSLVLCRRYLPPPKIMFKKIHTHTNIIPFKVWNDLEEGGRTTFMISVLSLMLWGPVGAMYFFLMSSTPLLACIAIHAAHFFLHFVIILISWARQSLYILYFLWGL